MIASYANPGQMSSVISEQVKMPDGVRIKAKSHCQRSFKDDNSDWLR
jgi:hypothetical protein